MAIQQPPITDDPSLNFILLELIKLVNDLEQQNLKLLKDIEEATNFTNLQTKVKQ